MKRRTCQIFIKDIVEAINKIERYIKGLNYESFVKNEMVIDAVLRNLEIIGEASNNIPEVFRQKHPHIPWKRMIGLRNIAIHEYFGVDLTIIWEIITKNLAETKPAVVEVLKGFNEVESEL